MRKISKKQEVKNELYKMAKIEKKQELIAKCEWVGFFSNKSIPLSILPGFHHKLGRDGDLMTDKDNIEPIQNNTYHNDYHHRSIEYLLKQGWYIDFLDRCELFNPNVYNLELKRINKANIISDIELLERWID